MGLSLIRRFTPGIGWSYEAEEEGGGEFDGGTITTPLSIEPTDPTDTALRIVLPEGAGDEDFPQIVMIDEDGDPLLRLFADGGININALKWGGIVGLAFAANRGLEVYANGTKVFDSTNGISLPNLPIVNPAIAGRLWNDAGTLKVSAG